MLSLKLASVALYAIAVQAQQPLWAQCGGTGFSGSTTCVSGAVCSYLNAWYSQCVPGTASTTLVTSTTKTTTTASKSTTTSSKSSTQTAISGTKYLITFGDSYSQTGFDPTGTLASASNPLGNPSFPGYTTDNGINWIGYLVSKYNTSLTLSYNFAYGGATVDSNLVTPYASTVLSLVQQVSEFTSSIASHPSNAPWTSSNTLFGIWIGINDVGNTWSNSASTETTLLGKIFDQYFAQVQILYNAGGRNFVFLTVPPTNRSPLFVSDGASAQAGLAAVIAQYNSILSTRVANFVSTHTGVTAKVVDTQPVFNTLLDANPTAAACYNADGVTCLWWNNYHAGQKIQQAVGAAVAAAESGTFF